MGSGFGSYFGESKFIILIYIFSFQCIVFLLTGPSYNVGISGSVRTYINQVHRSLFQRNIGSFDFLK